MVTITIYKYKNMEKEGGEGGQRGEEMVVARGGMRSNDTRINTRKAKQKKKGKGKGKENRKGKREYDDSDTRQQKPEYSRSEIGLDAMGLCVFCGLVGWVDLPEGRWGEEEEEEEELRRLGGKRGYL